MSEPYLTNVTWTDAQVGRVLAALDERGLLGETLIIVTSDHGGHDFVHGGSLPEDMTIPWIVAGPGVAGGQVIGGVSIADTAPTALWALGLSAPQTALGRARADLFAAATAPPGNLG
jgi:arylsulfatase A-like enzyme